MKVYNEIFNQIIRTENLLAAWNEFRRGKTQKPDVQAFEYRLEENVFALHREFLANQYRHKAYTAFTICDPKVRRIHKATVRDRVVHHAVYRVLNPIFEPTFIPTSFSCRVGKGTHAGVLALEKMARQVSLNYTRPCFVLKCDIQKFFDSIDHEVLLILLGKRIADPDAMWLLDEIIRSYSSVAERERERVKAI